MMKDLYHHTDGTVTAEWAGRKIVNARRGFYKDGRPCWPKPGRGFVEGGGMGPVLVREYFAKRALTERERRRQERYRARERERASLWSAASDLL